MAPGPALHSHNLLPYWNLVALPMAGPSKLTKARGEDRGAPPRPPPHVTHTEAQARDSTRRYQ